jgi:ubiquinone/menaquinone biosynthesis C-methylase UbiE
MQNLPTAETYDKEFKYMPWGQLVREIQQIVIDNVPEGGRVLDLLCGTGYLIADIKKKRADIEFVGVDLEDSYIRYAQEQYPGIEFIVADALEWESDQKFNAVLCTGGLHHVPYDKQGILIQKIAAHTKENGFAIVADPYIDNYESESERKIAAAKLGYQYLVATIQNGAPDDVIEATVNLIPNDVMLVEFKSSLKKIEPLFHKSFQNVEKHKTWPLEQVEYGDYYFVLKR